MIMRIQTHEDDKKIPKGKAFLCLDNGGYVGTNNEWPGNGQPALFLESQARAILTTWTYVQMYYPDLEEMPHPECIPEKVKHWITGDM